MGERLAKNEVALHLYGDKVRPGDVEQAVTALGGLVRELTRAVCGDPDVILWKVGPIRWICDGCESDRPEDAEGWVYIAPYDFCPDCQLALLPPGGGS